MLPYLIASVVCLVLAALWAFGEKILRFSHSGSSILSWLIFL